MHELITIDVSGAEPVGLGAKHYAQLPRIGKWVEMNVQGIGTMFEVVMVAHSDEGHGCDLYVKRLGLTPDLIQSLCSRIGAAPRSS